MPVEMAAALLILAVVVAGVGWALVDLATHDVWYLPKWLWAVIILLLSMPLGVGAYAVAGRVGRRGHPLVVSLRRHSGRGEGEYTVLGMVVGMAIGLALDQLYLWLPLGLVIGLLLDERQRRTR